MKLETHENYSDFYKGILEAKIVINDTNLHNSVFSFINWKVIEYLESDEHKDVSKWQLPTPLPRGAMSESMGRWTAVICRT
jgi:hypothetical protein